MPVDATSATATTAPFAQTAPIAKPKEQLGTDTFLNLLVAQLKYQNPMSPSDGTQFLAQTAQFTMVEKLTEMADLTKSLLSDNQALAAAAMLGRTVSWADGGGNIQSGVVSGATFGSKGASVMVGDQQIALSDIRDVRATEPSTAAPGAKAPEVEAPETEATDGSETTGGTDAVDDLGTSAPLGAHTTDDQSL